MVWSIRIYIALDFSSLALFCCRGKTRTETEFRGSYLHWEAAMINRDRIFKFNFAINSRCFRIRNAAGEAIFSLGINCMCVMEIPNGSLHTSALSLCERHSGGVRRYWKIISVHAALQQCTPWRLAGVSARQIHLAC